MLSSVVCVVDHDDLLQLIMNESELLELWMNLPLAGEVDRLCPPPGEQ